MYIYIYIHALLVPERNILHNRLNREAQLGTIEKTRDRRGIVVRNEAEETERSLARI